MEKVVREKAERERRYTALCRSIGKDPEPFSPLLSEDEPPPSVAEDLEQGLRVLLTVRGFDPAALKKAIDDFVDSSFGAAAIDRPSHQQQRNGGAGAIPGWSCILTSRKASASPSIGCEPTAVRCLATLWG